MRSMTIALIAHDAKKELMVQFCIAYCGILSKHKLCATAVTAKYISEATGLTIDRLMTGSQGGARERILCAVAALAPAGSLSHGCAVSASSRREPHRIRFFYKSATLIIESSGFSWLPLEGAGTAKP